MGSVAAYRPVGTRAWNRVMQAASCGCCALGVVLCSRAESLPSVIEAGDARRGVSRRHSMWDPDTHTACLSADH